jgi:exosortase/archaeosortase family protein
MLLVTALILGHLFLRTFWGQLAFAALVVPFAVAKNAVRIFTLSVLGMYVNRSFLEGHLHHDGGIVFFVVALGGLMLVLQGIRWLERRA